MTAHSVAIPSLTPEGLLPAGVHTCSIAEIEDRFGRFNRSDRRIGLTAKFREFIEELKSTCLVTWVAVDGSYVTDKAEPDDIDLVVALEPNHDFSQELAPAHYNAISRRRVKRRYGFDVLVAPEDSAAIQSHLAFFQRTRDGRVKGILKVQP